MRSSRRTKAPPPGAAVSTDSQPNPRGLEACMAPRAIISYDDTPGDHDALMLGRVLADAGASLTLAYVRHCTCDDCPEDDNAATLLARGADRLAGLDVDTRVVVSASTPEGLCRLISEQHADIVVF